MPLKNPDLHGNVPDSADLALLLIDVINDLEFAGSEPLADQAMAIAEQIAALKRRAKPASRSSMSTTTLANGSPTSLS